jgi:hypothetical protein
VAKSAWKFLKTNQIEFYKYNTEFKLLIKNQGYQEIGLVKNSFIINNINYSFRYAAYIGDTFINKKFYNYCVGLKMRQFLKFKKPFHYRSKKNK